MNRKSAAPKDASAVILLNENLTEVLWIQRSPSLAFLGGWHAFPGGKLDANDAAVKVENCDDQELEKFIVCAARETFEETGILLARGGDRLTKGQRASLHDDLTSGRSSLGEIFENWNLRLDAKDFFYTGFWTTPEFSPVRFKTRFFIAVCPLRQKPCLATSETAEAEFVAPGHALEKWTNAEVLISPPVLISLRELAEENLLTTEPGKDSKTKSPKLKTVSQKLLKKSEKFDGVIDYIDLNSHITVFPLRTETLPPATHTNCFIAGRKKFVVIDAASREETEHRKLFALVDEMIASGGICEEIIVSHLHPDHFGGETALQKHLKKKFDREIPISAHRLTAESLKGKIEVQKFIEDEDVYRLADENGAEFDLVALHTPGHARGHLCFYDESKGFLLSSDNVVGTNSVVIAPPEGNLIDYLDSLEEMKNLPNLRNLCGSHGSAIYDAKAKIESYIEHRLTREDQIKQAIDEGAKTPAEIVEKVYAGLDEKLFRLAEKSVEAHLEKLETEQFKI